MKIIEPSVELWKEVTEAQHVSRCARVCYGKDHGDDGHLIAALIKNNHLSMFRHSTYYAIAPYNIEMQDIKMIYENCPYIKFYVKDRNCYIITNGHFMLDAKDNDPESYDLIIDHLVPEEKMSECEYVRDHYMRYTLCITTQISTSRELNRVSPNNISEQSTRYVPLQGVICKPYWLYDPTIKAWNDNIPVEKNATYIYLSACESAFQTYNELKSQGILKGDARGVLPLDTATKCVYTYSIDEWKHLLDLRYYGKTGQPHPNCVVIGELIKKEFEKLNYNL